MKLVVIIDAGHGLYTQGKETTDKKMKEFEFNNITAQYFKTYIDDYENVETHYVHDLSGKTDVPLTDRINKANSIYAKHAADVKAGKTKVIYISFHANAHGDGTQWTTANGIETFVYKKTLAEANKLANAVQTQLIATTKRSNRGVKEAAFRVIKETDMTAILIECGFMTNREEAALLKTDGYRKICAKAISDGTAITYNLKAKQEVPVVTVPVAKPQPSDWELKAEEEWNEAVENGYFDGTNPDSELTRLQGAIVINRLRRNFKKYSLKPLEDRIEKLEKIIDELTNK